MTKFNAFAEIIEEGNSNNREKGASIADILADIPIVDFHQEYGIEKPSISSRIHTKIGECLSKHLPTFTKVYLTVRDKIKY